MAKQPKFTVFTRKRGLFRRWTPLADFETLDAALDFVEDDLSEPVEWEVRQIWAYGVKS